MANRVRELREKHGLTLTDFASRIKVNYTTVNKWETSGVIPRTKAIRICNEFGCSLDWLLAGSSASGETSNAIGQRLQDIRGRYGWTMAEMAKVVGVTLGSIGLWERTGNIPARRLRHISEMCNVSYEWLKTGKGAMFAGNDAPPQAGSPKDVAVMCGFDHRSAEAIERFVKLPDDRKALFVETLAYIMFDRPMIETARISAARETAENVGVIKKTVAVRDTVEQGDNAADSEVIITAKDIETLDEKKKGSD